ncbi:hypothetical protein [Streptomyces sp. NRRL F-5053]|uniref:hypothetical protein n=1 Tax=Streptomyces sp. NRRL F-5053 TaxID=1463854 RepID=UPI0004C9E7CD|nr:hypothetical protein [Streptomyces sp. NRRL F-5053]
MTHRRRNLLIALASALAVLAGVGWSTGMFDDWRDKRSLGDACEGVLAEEALPETLGSEHAFAGDSHPALEGALTRCVVRGSEEATPALRVDLRWAGDGHRDALPEGYTDTWAASGAAAPMEHERPGVVSGSGRELHATMALACPAHKDTKGHDALLLTGRLTRSDARTDDAQLRADLARFISGSASKAADKYGCRGPERARAGQVAEDPLDHPVPVQAAKGSCAAARDLRRQAADTGLTLALETPADPHAPLADCFLATDDNKPGVRLSFISGAYAPSYAKADSLSKIRGASGIDEEENSYAWATAVCPGSSERSLFTTWSVQDSHTKNSAATDPPPDFLHDALTAFAKRTAQDRGCTDLRLPTPHPAHGNDRH